MHTPVYVPTGTPLKGNIMRVFTSVADPCGTDPYPLVRDADPDPDPHPKFFGLLLFESTFSLFFKDKKS